MSKFQYIIDGLIKLQEITSTFIHDILNYKKSLINNKNSTVFSWNCFWCWETNEHMAKDCLAEDATKPTWLIIQKN
ncbi:15411_t:CDS:2 [Gigaspora rosea]|nr:15411_t:CDS:2 [Gigaspora rosea]